MIEAAKRAIGRMGSMLVSYSGGVDSGVLAVLAHEVLGEKAHCVFLDSPVVPRMEAACAERYARDLGLSFEILPLPVMEDSRFTMNSPDRCAFCKKISAGILISRARELGLACVADGVNRSDLAEHRPGIRASSEEGIVHPFLDAGLAKPGIRQIARELGLPFWDMPSSACLCSRIPYGDEITEEILRRVEKAEDLLHTRGFRQVRVRCHGGLARIEVNREKMADLFAMHDDIVRELKSIGFSYVTLDLEGYRSGSMDEVLTSEG